MPGKGGIGIGKMAAHRNGIIGSEHAQAMLAQQRLGRPRACCRRRQRGAQMLAGMAAADRAAVMEQHLAIEPVDERELRGDRRVGLAGRRSRARGQPARAARAGLAPRGRS